MSERTRKIGLNEAAFREVNERVEELNRSLAGFTGTMEIVCECGDASCAERISMPTGDYERMRSDPTLFVVRPGHGAVDVEKVVERRHGYDLVRKFSGEPEEIARATDPRS